MKIKHLDGKILAVLLMGENGSVEEDWSVFTNPVHCVKNQLHFETDDSMFIIPKELLHRIEPVKNIKLKKILLDADFMLRLTPGAVPQSIDDTFLGLGLGWQKV